MSDILPKQSGKTSPLNAIRTNYLANINMTRIGHHADRLLFRSCLGRSKLFGKKCIRPVRPHQNQKIRSIWKNKTVQINLGVFGEFKDILKTHTITAAKTGQTVLVAESQTT